MVVRRIKINCSAWKSPSNSVCWLWTPISGCLFPAVGYDCSCLGVMIAPGFWSSSHPGLPVPCSEASILTLVFCNDPWQRQHDSQWNNLGLFFLQGAGGGEGGRWESSCARVFWGWVKPARKAWGQHLGEVEVQTSKAFSHYLPLVCLKLNRPWKY